jgi:hypothetical protein
MSGPEDLIAAVLLLLLVAGVLLVALRARRRQHQPYAEVHEPPSNVRAVADDNDARLDRAIATVRTGRWA